ncbi:MAG: hypothetical protein JNK89_00835 [Saprospiraceae bacterium]|nr:hypothetical protein [Saprospiraceae bacterium]
MLVKFWFSALFALLAFCISAQTPAHFAKIDARARRFEPAEQDFIAFSDSLTQPYASELEKARAIYSWQGAYLAYDCGNENRLDNEPETAMHPLFYTQQQLENILRTRRTRCDGFAFLFKLMCNLQGIYCSRREGYLLRPGETADPARVQPNHAWIAARLDGQWYEIDPTAGAGGCAGKQFRRQPDAAYFGMSETLLRERYIPITDARNSDGQGRIKFK